jgi:DNA-binding NarL/FixJ family response regulator
MIRFIQILAMLSHPSEICLPEAASQGVTGCILKTDGPGRFIQAVRAVAGGEKWFSRQLLQQTNQTQILATPEPTAAPLTEQEKEMLQLLCAEKSNAEIAAALHLSERTVCRYLEDMYLKLGVSSRVGAAVQATKRGLA